MRRNKNIWVVKPSIDKAVWEVENGETHEFVSRIWLAEWILDKWVRGEVVIVEHLHANDPSEKR